MTITETMALTLVASGGLSLYLVVHAAIDIFLYGVRDRDDK